MSIIENTAKATKRWKLQIDENEYQGHTSAIDYADNDTSTVWKGGDNNTIADVTPGDPTLSITMAEDTANAEGLFRLLFDAPIGTPMTLTFNPHYDDEFAVSVDFKSIRPPLHTDRAGGVPEVTVSLPCSQAVPAPVIP